MGTVIRTLSWFFWSSLALLTTGCHSGTEKRISDASIALRPGLWSTTSLNAKGEPVSGTRDEVCSKATDWGDVMRESGGSGEEGCAPVTVLPSPTISARETCQQGDRTVTRTYDLITDKEAPIPLTRYEVRMTLTVSGRTGRETETIRYIWEGVCIGQQGERIGDL